MMVNRYFKQSLTIQKENIDILLKDYENKENSIRGKSAQIKENIKN